MYWPHLLIAQQQNNLSIFKCLREERRTFIKALPSLKTFIGTVKERTDCCQSWLLIKKQIKTEQPKLPWKLEQSNSSPLK